MAKDIRQILKNVITSNKQREEIENNSVLNNEIELEVMRREQSMVNDKRQNQKIVEQINRMQQEEGFNFFKVSKLMTEGYSLARALNGAGMVPNTQYRLNYEGLGIMRIHNKYCDEACVNIDQSLILEDLIKKEMAVMCVIGYLEKSNYSVGTLIFNEKFGYIYIKSEKKYTQYITDLKDKMSNSWLIGHELNAKVELSKTFIKMSSVSALCFDNIKRVEHTEDSIMLKQLELNNPDGFKEMLRLLRAMKVVD